MLVNLMWLLAVQAALGFRFQSHEAGQNEDSKSSANDDAVQPFGNDEQTHPIQQPEQQQEQASVLRFLRTRPQIAQRAEDSDDDSGAEPLEAPRKRQRLLPHLPKCSAKWIAGDQIDSEGKQVCDHGVREDRDCLSEECNEPRDEAQCCKPEPCAICYETIKEAASAADFQCDHSTKFCASCVEKLQTKTCPLCREPLINQGEDDGNSSQESEQVLPNLPATITAINANAFAFAFRPPQPQQQQPQRRALQYYEQNRERQRAYQRQYYEQNRERLRAYQRAYRANREQLRERQRDDGNSSHESEEDDGNSSHESEEPQPQQQQPDDGNSSHESEQDDGNSSHESEQDDGNSSHESEQPEQH